MSEMIGVPCKFGTLVARVVRSDEDYAEIEIDLVRPDGRETQVCLAGTYENWENAPQKAQADKIHTMVWDGENEDPCLYGWTDPDGEQCY